MPDIDETTPGIMKDCEGIIPTSKGFRGAYSPVSAGLTAVSAEVNSAAVVTKLDGSTRRTFAGTRTTLEEAGASGWTDRTRTVGGAYTGGVDSRWSFAQYGNYTLAANGADVIQVSETTTFADINGAPEATYIAVSEGFIMAANNADTYADEWHCSAYLDYTDWAEAVSTQCTSGRLVGGGPITGLMKFGSGFVAFKSNSMYLANYVGAPIVWDWEEIKGDVGCPSSHACVSVQDQLFFMGNDDFYIFDGASTISIGKGIREWFFKNINQTYLARTIATYNPITGNVTWHYVSTGNSQNTPDKSVVYNVRTGKWGKFSLTIEAAANYYPAGITYDDLGSHYATYDDLPADISFDSPFWTANTSSAGVFKTDHILYTLTGVSESSSITMNTIGDDEQFTTMSQIRPRFISPPNSSSISYSYDDIYGDSFTLEGTYSLIDGRYDLLHSSRWHEVKFNFAGNMEIIGVTINLTKDGTE